MYYSSKVKSPPHLREGLDPNSGNRGFARQGGEVAPPLGMVKEEEVAVLVVLVRRHCCAVGAVVRRDVVDEVPGAVEEETDPAAVRCACL